MPSGIREGKRLHMQEVVEAVEDKAKGVAEAVEDKAKEVEKRVEKS